MNYVLHQIALNDGFYSSHFATDNTKAQGNWEGLCNSPEDVLWRTNLGSSWEIKKQKQTNKKMKKNKQTPKP